MCTSLDRIVLAGSEKTVFRYRIDGGMDERDKDEIECMDSGYVLGQNWPSIVSDSVDLRHRMTYIRKRNLGFSFICIPNTDFREYLSNIDQNLPVTLAHMVADFYRNGTLRVSDLLENVSRRNPAGLTNILSEKPYEKIMEGLITELAGDYSDNLFDKIFLDRIPADKFGCASIEGNKNKGYSIDLVLQLVFKV